MDSESIIKEIEYYCKQENPTGALLLTGEWGCGKTYLINDKLYNNADFKKEYLVLKISLFGINSAEQFEKALKMEYLIKLNLLTKVLPSINQFLTPAKEVAEDLKIPGLKGILSIDITNFINIKNYDLSNKKNKDKKKLIIIYDDFERCALDIDILMGLINEYIEDTKFHSIIITNEEEIINPINDANKDKNKIAKYLTMKEKLITKTLKITINIQEILKNINTELLNNPKDLIYKQFLEENHLLVEKVFKESRTENIRSLKCAIRDFKRVYDVLINHITKNEILCDIMYNFFGEIFTYKNPNSNLKTFDTFDDDTQPKNYLYMIDRYNQYKFNLFFVSIYNWINQAVWNEKLFLEELTQKLSVINKNKLLEGWSIIFYDDKDIKEYFPSLIQDAYDGLLNFNAYYCLLLLITSSIKYNVELPVVVDLNKIKLGINILINKIAIENQIYSDHISPNIKIDSLLEDFKLYDDTHIMKEIHQIIENHMGKHYDKIKRMKLFNALKHADILIVRDELQLYREKYDDEFIENFIQCYENIRNHDKYPLINLLLENFNFNPYGTNDKNTTIIFLDKLISLIMPKNNNQTSSNAMAKVNIEQINNFIDNLK